MRGRAPSGSARSSSSPTIEEASGRSAAIRTRLNHGSTIDIRPIKCGLRAATLDDRAASARTWHREGNMAKRAVSSTATRRVVDSTKTDVMSESDVTRQPDGQPTEDEVRMRAYHRYLERGATDGSDIGDWVEAEKELRFERRS